MHSKFSCHSSHCSKVHVNSMSQICCYKKKSSVFTVAWRVKPIEENCRMNVNDRKHLLNASEKIYFIFFPELL